MKNNFIITGAPDSGKSTLIQGLELKGFNVIHEAARDYISYIMYKDDNQELMKKSNNIYRQEKIIKLHIQREQYLLNENINVFTDSSPLDSLAYLKLSDLEPSEDILKSIEEWRKTHSYSNEVFLLDIIENLQDDKDELSFETNQERKILHEYLITIYSLYGFEIINVPVIDIESRIQFVMKYL